MGGGMLVQDMGLGSGAHRSQVDGHFLFPSHNQLVSKDPVKPYCLMQRLWTSDLCNLWLLNLRQRSEGLDEPGAWLQVQSASAGPLGVHASQLFCLNPLIATCPHVTP